MPSTNVILDPNLDEKVLVYTATRHIAEACEILRKSQLLVIDDLTWDADLEIIRTALENKSQDTLKTLKGKHPQWASREPSPEASRELAKLRADTDRLFAELYPTLAPTVRHESFRPMIVRDATLHYDHHDGQCIVTAYMNIARTPRIYNLARSFPGVVKDQPEVMKAVMRECAGNLGAMSKVISKRTKNGLPPLAGSPAHRIELAPGSIWFFDAKTVSHQVVYGEGVAGQSWEVPGAMKTQRQHIAEIK